jgi:hypothetical protein
MTFSTGVVNSINCQVEPNLHLENFHFPIFLKPAVIPQFIVTNLRHSKLLLKILVTQHEKRYFSKSSKYRE